MKFAVNHAGSKIEAGANAPRQAICPVCKAIVILRNRQRDTPRGEVTYFWRHENHSNPMCLLASGTKWSTDRLDIG